MAACGFMVGKGSGGQTQTLPLHLGTYHCLQWRRRRRTAQACPSCLPEYEDKWIKAVVFGKMIHKIRGKGMTLHTSSTSTVSDERLQITSKRERGKGADCGTGSSLTSMCKEGQMKEAVQLLDVMEKRGHGAYSQIYARFLQGYAKTKALADGKCVHAHIIKSGLESNTFLGNILISMYCKCGSVMDARRVFDKMPERNVISWTAMIAGLAKQGHGYEAFNLFGQMQREGVKADKVTFMSILNACASPKDLEQGKQLHMCIMKAGLELDVHVGTALICMYCKCGNAVDARRVFDKLPKRDVIAWNAMIAGLAKQRHSEESFELFGQMQQEGLKASKVTFMSILNACTGPVNVVQGKGLHMDIIQAGLESDAGVGTALVSMYCKCGSLVDALDVFDKMPKPGVISWNAMITGFAQQGHVKEAIEFFKDMQRAGVEADKVTYMSMLKAFASPVSLEQGKVLHVQIIKAGLETDVHVGTALVTMYCKCGDVVGACRVFDNMPKRDVISWNAMITGFLQQGHIKDAFKLFQQMQREGMQADKATFMSILNACTSSVYLEQGKWLHAVILKAGLESDVQVGTAIVTMYLKCGSVVAAHRVFDGMLKRDVISWNAMIAGLAQQGHAGQAFEIFEQMQREGVKADKVTFISILNVSASLAALEEGKCVHVLITKSGLESDIRVCNALVDMYAKCGSVGDARQVFDRIVERDVVSWNAMLVGCAQHGRGREALQLFEQMQQEGVKPDNWTFTGVLSACSHVGLVDEGHHYFLSITGDHGMTPTGIHYNCMVDLLGRAGCLDEAEDFINSMPFEPDALVWGALLGACRIHRNVEVAERAAECILKFDPEDAAVYVLLSDIYAAAGRWDAMMKVRNAMRDRGFKKEPGRSWIQVENRVHSFVVEDKSHPQLEEINTDEGGGICT